MMGEVNTGASWAAAGGSIAVFGCVEGPALCEEVPPADRVLVRPKFHDLRRSRSSSRLLTSVRGLNELPSPVLLSADRRLRRFIHCPKPEMRPGDEGPVDTGLDAVAAVSVALFGAEAEDEVVRTSGKYDSPPTGCWFHADVAVAGKDPLRFWTAGLYWCPPLRCRSSGGWSARCAFELAVYVGLSESTQRAMTRTSWRWMRTRTSVG